MTRLMTLQLKWNFILLIKLACLSALFPLSVHADLNGMWECEHDELGGVFFRVKSDGTCTYFLEKGTDTAIHHGEWSEIPTGIEMVFDNGVRISAGELEEGVADVRLYMSGAHEGASEEVVAKATRISSRVIGRMTVNPDEEDEEEERIGYFGAWEGELLNGQKIYFHINEDRTAGMSHRYSGGSSSSDTDGFDQVVGYWRKDGEKLQMYWNDGSFTIIETIGRRVTQTTFEVGAILEEAQGYTCTLIPIREEDFPETWFDTFKKDYVTRMPIIVLRSAGQIKSFFKGKWNIDDGSGEVRSMQIKMFGNARTDRFGGIKGDWAPASDSINIVWNNGVRETVKPVGNKFLLMSYNPNQPTSGRPVRISRLEPEDEDKMGYYINRKTELLDPRFYLRPSSFDRMRTNQPEEDQEEEE